MEINDTTIQQLTVYLQQTLSPDVNIRKPAEKFLESVEHMKNYPIVLLKLIEISTVDVTVRIAGAIVFKNFVKRNWRIDEDSTNKIHEQDRDTVKKLIVNLMLTSPDSIQKQLSDAIAVIGREDFPMKWPDLLKEMVEKFASGDFNIINGVLQTAHSLFRRYRHEFQSNTLWTEIKFVLENFALPLTNLFVTMMGLVKQHENNKQALEVVYSSLVFIAKIFNSLNCQDLPEFFEDNMQIWMNNFHILLVNENPLLKTGDTEEAGVLEQLKSQICDNVGMYAQKYDEEFAPFLPNFVTAVWNLLITTGNQPKYDLLVSNAIQFLALVADKDKYKSLFEDPNTMSNICQKVIIPNMEFRETDEELFEDNPEEYIRRDIEGSDFDTRRRAACDLVRALSRHFEERMTTIFGQYVQAMLQKYAENKAGNWKNKDAAIYLVTSVVAKGQTQKHGVTQTNQLVNLLDFYIGNILPDLNSANVNEVPVLKADAIKYVMIFRNQLPQSTVKESIPFIVNLLTAESPVVHTYAACAIEKMLLMRQTDNTGLIKAVDLAPFALNLLSNLFGVLERPASKENEYIMKAIMRSLSCLQDTAAQFMDNILPKLTQILISVSRNPSKPHFNHYMLESLSLCIRIMCKKNPQFVNQFETALFPVFQGILQQDIVEFIPYTFQVMSLLLEIHTDSIPEPYMALFPFLLAPVLWERPANISPLVRLLQSFIARGPQQVVATGKLDAMLGVFQKLIASKANDHEGFYLVQSMIEHLPDAAMVNYLCPVFRLLFHRITSSKTTKFVKSLLVYFGIYIIKYGAANFIQIIDSIEPNFYGKVVEKLFIAEVQKISGPTEKKICAVGITKLLCDVPEMMVSGPYGNYWPHLLQALIGLFELPEDNSTPDDEHFIEIEDTPGYQTAYVQLNFAGKTESDLLKGTVPDPKLYLAQNLGKLSMAHPGKIKALVTSAIAPEAQNFLTKYLQIANVQLV